MKGDSPQGRRKRILLGSFIVVIPFVVCMTRYGHDIYYHLNPVPTHVPLGVYCIDRDGVQARIDSLMEEVVDSDDVEFKYSYTSRPSRMSRADRRLADAGKSGSEDFFASTQKFGVEFSARKRGTERYEPGSLHVYLEDKTCTILHHTLRW